MSKYVHSLQSMFLIVVFSLIATACVQPLELPKETAASMGGDAVQFAAAVSEDMPAIGEEFATITFLDGEVIVEEPIATGRPPGLASLALRQRRGQARPFQRLRMGSIIRVGRDARVTVVDRNDRVVTQNNGNQIAVNESTFDDGQSMPDRSSDGVTQTSSGHFQVNNDSKQIRFKLRETDEDFGTNSIILAPRNTGLSDIQPAIAWTSVADATAYKFSLSSRKTIYPDIIMQANQLECVDHELASPGQLCTVAWPEAWDNLAMGETFFLQISARTGRASKWRDSEKSRVSTLKADKVATLDNDVAEVNGLEIDDVTKNVLLAGRLTEYGLFGDAIAAYQAALAEQPTPILYVTLGDTYRAVELNRFAFQAYESALALLDRGPDDQLTRAAARFGQGQVEYRRLKFEHAEPHFERALELYTEVDGTEGMEASQLVLEATREALR